MPKKSIKHICRELRVSRNTVRKVIRSGATELTCERTIQPLPKIGPWKDMRDEMLAVDLPGKSGEHQLRNQEVFYVQRETTDAGISA